MNISQWNKTLGRFDQVMEEDEWVNLIKKALPEESVKTEKQKKMSRKDNKDDTQELDNDKNYLINCNKSRDASSIEWASEDYNIQDLEPYIYSIQCDDGEDFHDLIHKDYPYADGKDDFKTISIDGFQAIDGDNENEFFLCFTAIVNINLNNHPVFKEALGKSDNMVVARIGFKENGKPILDNDGYEVYLFAMGEDVFVKLELASNL